MFILATGFRKGQSIYTNAQRHLGAICIVNLDLKLIKDSCSSDKLLSSRSVIQIIIFFLIFIRLVKL